MHVKNNSRVILILCILALLAGGYLIAFRGSGVNPPIGYSLAASSGGVNPQINSNRTVEIVEFSDFQCSYCGAAEPTVKQVLANYGSRVNFVYKNYPLSIHPYAWKAAEAYEIALQYGKGTEYHDILFANQNALDVDSLKKYARQVGIPGAEFDRLLDSGAMSQNVSADQAEGERLGVTGTPTFFINGRMLVGSQPYSEFEKIINEELSK
jgi:protein-disulfide isomerase